MESTWITKKIFQKALKERRVFLTSAMQTNNGTTGYNVYIVECGNRGKNIDTKWLCGHSAYWSDSKECYHCTGWGMSRPLEIILSIGYSLGLKFDEIPQKHAML